MTYREAKRDFDKQYFTALMARHDGNVATAALEAEVNRTHLYRRLKDIGYVPHRRNAGSWAIYGL